jgi:hypothetical protein
MNILTPTGYKNIEDVNIGDELIAYDINTGDIIINTLLGKDLWANNMLPENPPLYQSIYNEETLEYEEVLVYEGMSSEEVFQETHGDWKFYEINGIWKLYKNQSIWSNMKLVHVSDLQIDDIIYDDEDNDVTITSIVECVEPSWWRLTVSGDKSYIADNIQLHNASRFWQKQNASFNWNATGPTNWGSASGVSDNASIPTSVDDVFFNGVGVNGNINNIVSANITVLSVTFTSGYTVNANIANNVLLTIAGNFTDNSAHTWTVGNTVSRLVISATSTITTNGRSFPGSVLFSNTNTKTLIGNWTILGSLFVNDTLAGQTTTINRTTTEEIICNGLNNGFNSNIQGTITIRITGGAITFQGGGNNIVLPNILFDGNISSATGVLQFSGSLLRWVSGTFPVSTLSLRALTTTTLETSPIIFNNFEMNVNSIITLNTTLNVSGTFAPGSTAGSFPFIGVAGFDIGTFTPSVTTGAPLILRNGNTYIIRNITGGIGSAAPIQSDSATLRANIILPQGGTCNTRVNFTRIDATGGRTINTWSGVVTDCVNVRRYTDLQTVATSIIT